MIAVSIIYIILGMFLDPLGMILLTIPVFVPMFAALKLDLVWFGVLVVKYIGIGLLTPPVGFNVYVVKNAVGEFDPAGDHLQGLPLVPGLRGVHHDVADRLPGDLAVAAELHQVSAASPAGELQAGAGRRGPAQVAGLRPTSAAPRARGCTERS